MAATRKTQRKPSPPQQLAPLDGIFLSLETPETPGHVGGLAVLDPSTNEKFDFEHLRDFVAERIALCPRFTWRVAHVPLGLDLPYWVDDEEIDFNHHVRRAAIPSPGGPHELADLVGQLYALPLDRTRPLWEMFLIEGLQGGRVALLWKVHHCLMDGESGAGLMELLFDVSPDPTSRIAEISQSLGDDDSTDSASLEVPSWNTMLTRSLRNSVKRNTKLAQTLVDVASNAIATATSDLKRTHSETANGSEQPEVPRTSFNGAVSSRRAIAWSTVRLAEIKEIKEQLGVTVNDVLLGLTGGAVRDYLEARGELPEQPLRASVAMSTRKAGDTSVGNQVRDMTVDWGTDIAHPIERIMRIHQDSTRAKAEVAAGGLSIMVTVAETLPPIAHQLFVRATSAFADHAPLPGNAVVSNVRMPNIPFYIAGAKINASIPISVLMPTQGLNITAITYCDEIFFGITADPRLVSDPWIIAEGASKSLFALQAAVKDWSSTVG